MYKQMAHSIFRMQNFFDEISIIDTDGIIRYCELFTSDTYSFTADEIIGKHVFEVFPSSNEENSEIYSVLKTGIPIASFEEDCITYKGDIVKGYSSVYPVYEGQKLIGAAVALKFFNQDYKKEFIKVQHQTGTRSRSRDPYTLDDIITADPEMAKIKEKIRKVSNFDSAVLIEGKTGTGKELVAQSLHYSGVRSDKPFVSQNCSAIPENLLESTLFGTEKGSYTGAVNHKGLFELADGGTLFLDEINSMDLHLQAKVLKAIEDQSIRRLGGLSSIHVDVRIIAAINEDPFEAIQAGRLRSDLFYRLNVISFQLPELKSRTDDIKKLTEYYIGFYNKKLGMNVHGLSPEAETFFISHSWPGNVRELKNVIEGAFAVCDNRLIGLDDLPPYMNRKTVTPIAEKPLDYQTQVEEFERNLLRDALRQTATKTEAAKLLGMTKQALNYKLDTLGLK